MTTEREGTNRDDWDCDRLARLGSTRINKGIEKPEEIALFSSHPNKANLSQRWKREAEDGRYVRKVAMRMVTSAINDVILIVDGSKFVAQAYSRVLLGLGYRVLVACDGKTGLSAAASCNPSIILLAMLLPDMDGIDVLRTLKQTPSTTDIPVLIISSLSEKNGKKLIQGGQQGTLKRVP